VTQTARNAIVSLELFSCCVRRPARDWGKDHDNLEGRSLGTAVSLAQTFVWVSGSRTGEGGLGGELRDPGASSDTRASDSRPTLRPILCLERFLRESSTTSRMSGYSESRKPLWIPRTLTSAKTNRSVWSRRRTRDTPITLTPSSRPSKGPHSPNH